MTEVRYEVQTFVTEYICDECGEGKMRPISKVLLTKPPRYPHRCMKCNAMKTFTGEPYPRTHYERIGVPS